jgi:propanediol dehydratase small subunit
MDIFSILFKIAKRQKRILMRLSDLLTLNNSLYGQVTKIDAEVTAKLAELQAAIDNLTATLADAPLTDEQASSVDAVVAAVQKLDDIILDPAPEESPVE